MSNFHLWSFMFTISLNIINFTKATKKKELQPLRLPLYSRNMKKITRKSDSPFRMADLHIFFVYREMVLKWIVVVAMNYDCTEDYIKRTKARNNNKNAQLLCISDQGKCTYARDLVLYKIYLLRKRMTVKIWLKVRVFQQHNSDFLLSQNGHLPTTCCRCVLYVWISFSIVQDNK